MKVSIYTYFIFVLIMNPILFAQERKVSLTDEGFISVWLVTGPFDQPLTGFGVPEDQDMVDEKNIKPVWGKEEKSILIKDEKVEWLPQSISPNGFLDFNQTLRWQLPANVPEKIWYAITGYAAAYVESPADQNVVLSFGSNSFGKIFVNGEEVFTLSNSRNANVDQDKIEAALKKGENLILVKAGNSNANHELAFFEMIKWEWGFYLKLLDQNGNALKNVEVILPQKNEQAEFNTVSTFFFKKSGEGINQRFDIEITSPFAEQLNGKLEFKIDNQNHLFNVDSIPFGLSRHHIYIPEIKSDKKINAVLSFNNKKIEKAITLHQQKHYELHMMMLAHTDIGYTHPQPVVKEIHSVTLDEVVEMCAQHNDFHWTIETLWQLEQYEQSRSSEQFQKVIELIRQGRIAVSPLYTNPFTGWVGEEEMIRSLSKAKEYQDKYGLKYNAAVYNDVPGQAWFIPQLLKNANVNFLAEGLNEFFNNYSLQQALPKAFIWKGSDGSEVITYRNEAYNEGKSYGLEGRGNFAVQQRMWERLNKLKTQGYDFELVLLNTAFGDNSIVPKDQYTAMMKWNDEYEYPKFISSNVSKFAEEFSKRYKDSLQILQGDWTSNWDVYYQGEPDLMKKQRAVQNDLLSAEKLAALTWLIDENKNPLTENIDEAYQSLLNFSGHGSGLEYGYGSPAENLITMEYREDYIHNAYLKADDVLRRSIFRVTKTEESFEGEGLIIFNTLSWQRDVPVEIQFSFESSPQYEIIDLSNNEKVESFREGFKQIFIARDIPSFGYKKYRLQQAENKFLSNDLWLNGNSIENQFYKIEFDKSEKRIVSIVDKKSNKELIDKESLLGFNQPLIEKFQNQENFSQIKYENEIFEVKDETPVRIIIKIKRENQLFEETSYTLWNNIDRVDVEHVVNLEKLKSTDKLEEYAIAFPFDVEDQENFVEIIGGYINPDKDKLPGTDGDGLSIRRSAAVFNDEHSISWTSTDARVIRLRENGNKKTLISNMVNNFPVDWNRYEENEGKLNFRYSFTNHNGGFNSSFTSRFGWEISTPAVVKKSWYKSEPASKSYLNIEDENIILLTIIPSVKDNSYSIRLMNSNPDQKIKSKISSEYFEDTEVFYSTYLGNNKSALPVDNNSITVELGPNEITTLKILLNKKDTVKND